MLSYVIIIAIACILFVPIALYMWRDYVQSKIYLKSSISLGTVIAVFDESRVNFYGPVLRRKYSEVFIKFEVDGRDRVCTMLTQGWHERVGRMHCVHYCIDENNKLKTYDDIPVRRYMEMRGALIAIVSVLVVATVSTCFVMW